MKLIVILFILLLMSCKNNSQPQKTTLNFNRKNTLMLFADSTAQKTLFKKTIEKQKTDLEKLKLNGKVAMTCEVFFDVYLVGKTYYKVNTFGIGWDPNDIDSTYFNEDGFVTKSVSIYAKNNFSSSTYYNYNANNELISPRIFNPEKFTESVGDNHIFGPQSDPYFRKDTVISIFNEKEYLIEKQVVDLNSDTVKSVTNFVYYFDKNENWIKCIMYQNGVPIGITERTIEYYH